MKQAATTARIDQFGVEPGWKQAPTTSRIDQFGVKPGIEAGSNHVKE